MVKKTLDLGEYKIIVDYDKKTGTLDVRVLDENGDLIEGILISDDEEGSTDLGINLN